MENEYVLVDFENVQPKNMNLLGRGPYKIKVFVGANQPKIPLEMARALQAFGSNAEYIQIEGHGRNALDFHIAYYIGRLSAENPKSHFHVISKDTGFDPLIRHLKALEVSCQRSKSLVDLRSANAPRSGVLPERVAAVIDNLAKRKSGKPGTVKKLRSTINALFGNDLADDELDRVVDQLTKRGVLSISDEKVRYEQSQ